MRRTVGPRNALGYTASCVRDRRTRGVDETFGGGSNSSGVPTMGRRPVAPSVGKAREGEDVLMKDVETVWRTLEEWRERTAGDVSVESLGAGWLCRLQAP